MRTETETIDVGNTGGTEADLDCRLRDIMEVVKPPHLSRAEKAALIAVLGPIRARLLAEAGVIDDTF